MFPAALCRVSNNIHSVKMLRAAALLACRARHATVVRLLPFHAVIRIPKYLSLSDLT